MKFLSLLVGAVLAVPLVGLGQECVDYGAQAEFVDTLFTDSSYVDLMTVSGDAFLLLVNEERDLLVYGLDDPEQPVRIGSFPLGADYTDIAGIGDAVYLCGEINGGVRILQIDTEGTVSEAGALYSEPTCTVLDLDVDGDLLGVALGDTWDVWDCSDPTAPSMTSTCSDGRTHSNISLDVERAVTWDMTEGLNLYDLTITPPVLLDSGFEDVQEYDSAVRRSQVVLEGDTIYVMTRYVYYYEGYHPLEGTTVSHDYFQTLAIEDGTSMVQSSSTSAGGYSGRWIPDLRMTVVGDYVLSFGQWQKKLDVWGKGWASDTPLGSVPVLYELMNAASLDNVVYCFLYDRYGTGYGVDIWSLPDDGLLDSISDESISGGEGSPEAAESGSGLVAVSRYSTDVESYLASSWIDVYDPESSRAAPVSIVTIQDDVDLDYYVRALDLAFMDDALYFVLEDGRLCRAEVMGPEYASGYEVVSEGTYSSLQALSGGLLALSCESGMSILDVDGASTPVIVSTTPMSAVDLETDGTHILALDGDGLTVIDMTDPYDPLVQGSIPFTNGRHITMMPDDRIVVSPQSAYYMDSVTHRLIDYHDPQSPEIIETWEVDSASAHCVYVSGNLYILGGYCTRLVECDDYAVVGRLGSYHYLSRAVTCGDRAYGVVSGGLVEIPRQCGSYVPIYLASLHLGLVDTHPVLTWTLGGGTAPDRFIVEGAADAGTWTVPVRTLGDGVYEARDTSAAPSADVIYRLYSETDGDLTLLAERTYTSSSTPSAVHFVSIAPNPFNPRTRVSFALDRPGQAGLRIYDAAGRLVRTLSTGTRSAGTHTVEWDGLDDTGAAAASGTYFFRLESESGAESRKALLVR